MLNLYTETAFQAVPPTPSSLLDFQIPRKNGSYDKSKFSNRTSESHPKDEQSYADRYLASASEIYFRHTKAYPRTFLWKVIAERVLQVQCADLSRSENDTKEAYLTLSFTFQDSILPNGIAFADAENAREIHIFVCTSRNEIFHLCIPTNAFRGPEGISQNVEQWCKPIDVSSLSIEIIYRLYASTPFEIFISYTSGKIQRLQRKANDENWIPENYDDRTWGASIRGIVGRGRMQTIEYGAQQLDTRVVQGMVASSDSNHLFTLCLNHQIRVWHLASGRLMVTKDLLDVSREPQDRVVLNPAENGFLQLIKLPIQRYPILVTYTPYEGGQFKFWEVKGGLTEPISLEDRYPGVKLSPPDPDPSGNTVWSLTGFKISPGNEFKPSQIWVLWRNNNYHQLYTTHFEFGTRIETDWTSNWVQCSTDAVKKATPPDLVRSDPVDVTSKWLEYLLRPGLYSEAALETALSIYQEAISAKATMSSKNDGLRQRLCMIVSGNISLRKYEDSDLDYDRFISDTDYQWRNYWRIVENINDGRRAPVALSYDLFSDMAWIVMTDLCCAVRECSMTELMVYNEPSDLMDMEIPISRWSHRKVDASRGESLGNMAQLVTAARTFRLSFPPELSKDLTLAMEEEMFVSPELTISTRIYEMYDSVSFGDGVSNEAFNQLEKNLEPVGGLQDLNDELFKSVINTIASSAGSGRPGSALRSTLFGHKLLSAGITDCLTTAKQVIWDLITLIIFIDGEMNQEDEKLLTFDSTELFALTVPVLKTLERNLWLATHSRLVPLEFMGPSPRPNISRENKELTFKHSRVVSLLDDILSKALQPQAVVDKPLMYHITEFLQEIQDWNAGIGFIAPDEGSVYLICDLLGQGEYFLATEFLRFQPATPWSTYIKGRLYLAKDEPDIAAQYFRKASYGLACGKAVGDLVELSAGLLSLIEVESFNNGLPRYFQHILTLFESSKSYLQAAQFARLALQSSPADQKEPITNFRTEVLLRLFSAQLQISHYDMAFQTLAQFSDHALQKSCTTSLIKAILDPQTSNSSLPGIVKTLQSLPWSLYPQLAKQLDQHLSSLAKKQKHIPSTNSQYSSTNETIDYLKIIQALKIIQGDFRGVVNVLFDRLRIIQRSGRTRNDPQATALRHALLALINILTCVTPDEAYILADVEESSQSEAMTNGPQTNGTENGNRKRKRKRIIITLDDLRREYQAILDKCSRIERGDFDFEVDDDGDSDFDNQANDDEMEVDRSKLYGVGRGGDRMEE